jgi:MATE family multidrug resistance protein
VPGLGTAVWLGLYTPLGGLGVWIGLLIGLVVVAALLMWRWFRRGALGLVPHGAPVPDSDAPLIDADPARDESAFAPT